MQLGKPFSVYKNTLIERRKVSKLLNYRIFRSDRNNTRMRRWVRSVRGHIFAIRYLRRIARYGQGPVEYPMIEETLKNFFPHSRIVGDKWPDYVWGLDQFVPMIKKHNGRCVMIYRDCRDVTSSTLYHVRTGWKHEEWVQGVNTSEKVARRWVKAIEIMQRYTDEIHIIRYEDLVAKRDEEIEKLARYLGVDPLKFPIQMIRDTNIGKYKQGLTSEELETVLRIAGPTMARLGYHLDPTPI